MGGAEFSQLLTPDVMNVLANGATRPVVRKKAALCLLRLIRKAPADAEIMQAEVGQGAGGCWWAQECRQARRAVRRAAALEAGGPATVGRQQAPSHSRIHSCID